ncbi:hypothetical protein PVL29_013653 [Vitis rotundifolia]|uniref:Uncharacterized protein n=1 Tax=Vitis rotundifolia TaxID=103349 RepID=A0AA39DRG8_VITRO|nr:hypothetical protein PVL29_013653 [Vitis rotundifolia]
MSAPSRSQSAMGSEDYFDWRKSMERRQQESERQVQALLQKTRRLRKENKVLRIQVSSLGTPRSRQPRSRMKALTPLVSHKKGDAIGGPSYRMRCAQG